MATPIEWIFFLLPHLRHSGGRRAGTVYIDCRAYPSEMNCTVMISADSETELIEAAVQHAVAVHKERDTPELREEIRKLVKTMPMEQAA